MYVRRFRPAPATDTNRYRGKIAIAHPLTVKGASGSLLPHTKPITIAGMVDGTECAFGLGVTLPLNKRVFFQPSYLWETSEGSRTVDYLLFGLIVNTR